MLDGSISRVQGAMRLIKPAHPCEVRTWQKLADCAVSDVALVGQQVSAQVRLVELYLETAAEQAASSAAWLPSSSTIYIIGKKRVGSGLGAGGWRTGWQLAEAREPKPRRLRTDLPAHGKESC
jgi:hypothetical protein